MSGDGRRRLARLFAAILALTAGSSAADPWGSPTPSQRLERFAEQKRAQARVGLLDTARRAERSLAERRLLRDGTPAQVAAYRRRIAGQDAADDLRLRAEAAPAGLCLRAEAASAGWWAALGPATRRVFLRNGLDLRRSTRDADREARLDALEDEVARRETDVQGPFAPLELP